jgi:hypothetical protein
MSLDPYAPCPCGSGKKLKFCCADVAADIEKIHRMIQGDQPRAALRHVEQTLATHPRQASLLDLKAILEISLGEKEQARSTIDAFLQAHPGNPSGLADRAVLLAPTTDVLAAVQSLQQALDQIDRNMPRRVLEALGVVGHALLVSGHLIAAQAHLWLYVSVAQDDNKAIGLLARLNQMGGLPLLVRDQLRLRNWPAGVHWKPEAERATQLASMGRWQRAVEIVDTLGQSYGADPSLVYNRAILGGWLADERSLVAGLHAFARFNVPWDDAVEAEAIAQLLDADLADPPVNTVRQVYFVNDLDALQQRLIGDKRTEQYEPEHAIDEGEGPRPRGSFLLLDRPAPDSGIEINRPDVPLVLGFLSLYGRQTDRAERLELVTDRGRRFDQTVRVVREIAGPALGDVAGEQIVGKTTEVEQSLSWRWAFPTDTTPARRRELLVAERREAIIERWPDVGRAVLSGKSPRDAARDDRLRIPLAAAVLILEQGINNLDHADAIRELRLELGLPLPEPIEPDEDAANISLVRIPRLRLERVADDDLAHLFRRAALTGAAAAIRAIAREALRRPSLADKIPPDEAYQRLIALENDPAKALKLIDEARQHSERHNESAATWDIAELELHFSEGNASEAERVLGEIGRRYRDQPEVAAAVYQLFYEWGLDLAQAEQSMPSSMPQTAAASSEAGSERRIWTPGDPVSSGTATGKKSSLWTPS